MSAGRWWPWQKGFVLHGVLPPAVPWQSAREVRESLLQPRSLCPWRWFIYMILSFLFLTLFLACYVSIQFQEPTLVPGDTLNKSDIVNKTEQLKSSPPMIQALVATLENTDEPPQTLGDLMNKLEQKELMIQEDDSDPEKVKLEMLVGNPPSEEDSSREKELQKLAIPTRYLPGGYKQYLLKSGWWTPPRWTKESGNYLDPLPYAGRYDELGRRWVNHEGKRKQWHELPFMERLARSRKPWCLLSREERIQVIRELGPGIKYWWSLFGWNIKEMERMLVEGEMMLLETALIPADRWVPADQFVRNKSKTTDMIRLVVTSERQISKKTVWQ